MSEQSSTDYPNSNSETTGTSFNTDEEDDEDEEEIEPKLKYSRLKNDLLHIFLTDAASCIAVHPKFICVGSHWGIIHVLDHQGNRITSSLRTKHTVAVNSIAIDSVGDWVASCSDDGKVLVQGLYATEHNQTLNVGRLVKTVALDPSYGRGSNNRRFIAGDDKLTLYERSFSFLLGGSQPRATELCSSEGLVRSLAWGDSTTVSLSGTPNSAANAQFIAWASDIGVRVYDVVARRSLGLIKWEQHEGLSNEKFRCNLRWADARTLLIGWVNTVRVCVIRRRNNSELANRDLAEFLVDPLSTFRTNFYISGIARISPMEHQLVLLGFPRKLDDNNKSLRPQLYIVEYRDHDYTEICMDTLTLRGYQEYSVNDYHLDVLVDENRFFIVAPKDVVIASPYDLDDRIQWLMQHGKFEQALSALRHQQNTQQQQTNLLLSNSLTLISPIEDRPAATPLHTSNSTASTPTNIAQRFTLERVGIAYLDHLLSKRQYGDAGKLCQQVFGRNRKLWEEEVFKFAAVHQLRSVSQYIPRNLDSKLNPHIYEMVLYEYLKMDSKGFLNLVKEWNPQLYNTSAVINAVLEHLLITDIDKNIYLEALAMLYSYEKKYDKSLSMYLKLRNNDVFDLIRKHNLYNAIHAMIIDLMNVDHDRTIAMLLEKNRIAPEVVVEKLKDNEMLLYKYLDALDKVDSRSQYHGKLVKLYAIFSREKLLPFLRRSDHYPIQEALDICEKARYYPEMVYLLGRIGDLKEALVLIISELGDMQQAIEFCVEHDDSDLWLDLIQLCQNKPHFVAYLLQTLGTYMDPTFLIERIKEDMKVPDLKKSLVKMLQTYNLQVEVQEGCKKILISDYFNLHKKLVRNQQKGIYISDDLRCGACLNHILNLDSKTNIIVYNCHHMFHDICLPDNIDKSSCGVCFQPKST